MAKRIVTMELVAVAADALVAAGIEPTVKLVQDRTGGSFSTVQPLLKTWKASSGQTAAVTVPAEVQARGASFVKDLYATVLLAAQASVEEPLKLAEEARDVAANEHAAALSEVSRLEAIGEEQSTKIETLEVRIHELELRVSVGQATIAELTGANLRLEGRLDEAQIAIGKRDLELAELHAAERMAEGLQDQLQAVQRSIQEEVASLRAASTTAVTLEGRLETLQRSVQGLADSALSRPSNSAKTNGSPG